MTNEEKFIEKSKKFRIYYQLTEDEIDLLLLSKNLIYKGIEAKEHQVTLELAESYPLIFGLEYCEFKKDKTIYPRWDDLPEATRNFIQDRPYTAADNLDQDALNNIASYVIMALRHLAIGDTFTDSDIIRCLPYPLNQGITIDWRAGMLKGVVKILRIPIRSKDENGNDISEVRYQLNKHIAERLLTKAKKKVGVD